MKQDVTEWYAMRVTYSRELKLKDYLEGKGVKCFLPMQHKFKVVKGKKMRILVPSIHNLIFVYCSRAVLDRLKLIVESIAGMRYIMDKSTQLPMVVPEQAMQNFIMISDTMDDQLQYTFVDEVKLNENDKVRITGGVFAGAQGCIMGTKKNCRVVVSIPGFMAVVTAHIDSSMLEKIPNN